MGGELGGECCFVIQLCHVQLFVIPCTAACQDSPSITNSQSLLKLMSIESVMPSNHLILCCSLLLLPSIFPSIRVFSNESALRIRWPKYWSFSFISPSNEHPGLISFRMDWLDLLAVQGTCYDYTVIILTLPSWKFSAGGLVAGHGPRHEPVQLPSVSLRIHLSSPSLCLSVLCSLPGILPPSLHLPFSLPPRPSCVRGLESRPPPSASPAFLCISLLCYQTCPSSWCIFRITASLTPFLQLILLSHQDLTVQYTLCPHH